LSDVDVVVVAYRSGAHLREAVVGLVGLAGVHVIVVDNACPDQSYREVADLGITIVHAGSNDGFAAGCNLGIAASASPSVLLLNPDASIGAGDIERLERALRASGDVGVVAPRILHADGTLAWSIRRFPRVRTTYAQALYLHRLAPRSDWADEVIRDEAVYTRPGDVEWASGAALLVRRSLLEQLGGLDDGFFLYCEDMDLCRRVQLRGYRVVFEPGATARHVGGASSSSRGPLLPVLAASRMRYAAIHRGRAATVLERGGIALGALTHLPTALGRRDLARGQLGALAASLGAGHARRSVDVPGS
jgi:N-acetylglucosaminyl-diphospho-decaprenol L-rhamnosyltransferase